MEHPRLSETDEHTQRRRVCVQMSTMEVTQLGTWGSRWKERVAFVVVKKNDKNY